MGNYKQLENIYLHKQTVAELSLGKQFSHRLLFNVQSHCKVLWYYSV